MQLPQLWFASPRMLPRAGQAARARRRARHRVRRDGRHARVSFDADHEAVPRRARRSARGVGRSPRSRAARRLRAAIRGSCWRPRREHGACPEMVTEELVRQVGPIDCICTHVDLDGLYAAAKWILGGKEPYRGADDDARAVDTRVGTPGPIATRIDRALRAKFRDDQLKRAVVQFLVGGMKPGVHDDVIARRRGRVRAPRRAHAGAREAVHDPRPRRGRRHRGRGRAVRQDRPACSPARRKAPVSIVRDSGMLTIAAAFESRLGLRRAVRDRRRDADARDDPRERSSTT